jgi:FixJ family two-component response regulator
MQDEVAEAVMMGDLYNAGRTLSRVCNQLGVMSCRIFDSQNKELFIYPSNSSHRKEHRFSSFPLIYGGKRVGRIEYEEKPVHWYELMENEFALVLGFVIFLGFVGFFVVRWLEKESKLAATGIHSQHVGHNIQSPLAALRAIYENAEFKKLSEPLRILFRSGLTQIEDLSNNLMQQHRKNSKSDELSVQPVASLIETVVSAKRSELRSLIGVDIKSDLTADCYGLFINVIPSEFKSAISNLINNAAQAIDTRGTVSVTAHRDGRNVVVLVEDNGKGIPEKRLPKLMEHGATYDKATGHGYGLSHAKKWITRWGGEIDIRSRLGEGTTVEMRLPSALPPKWFVPEIEVVTPTSVVVLDDDRSIHQTWVQRLAGAKDVQIIPCMNRKQLEDWHQSNQGKPALFLVDFELSDKEDGLKVIESLGIAGDSILITSRGDEKIVVKRCEELGVKLIPKGMAVMVPISVQDVSSFREILIDDNPATRSAWRSVAQDHGVFLGTLSSPKQFLDRANTFKKETPIYIDADLGQGIRGEEVAKKIHDAGFTNIMLATGYPEDSIAKRPWVKRVINKTPPWLTLEARSETSA